MAHGKLQVQRETASHSRSWLPVRDESQHLVLAAYWRRQCLNLPREYKRSRKSYSALHTTRSYHYSNTMEFYKQNSSFLPGGYVQPAITKMQHLFPRSALFLLLHSKGSLVILLVGLLFFRVLYNLFFHPLRKIPGPFLARSSELWRAIRYFRGTWHDDILELHKTYGQVVRISPGEVSFTSPEAIKAIYGHGKNVSKAGTSPLLHSLPRNNMLMRCAVKILQHFHRP